MLLELLSINTLFVHIPLGKEGYDLSYIEAIGTICGLLCILLASLEKITNYLFGLINVTLFAIIFFQINLYSSLLLQIFFFCANIYGWYAWSKQTASHEHELKIRWLSPLSLTIWIIACAAGIAFLTRYIDPVFGFLTTITVNGLQSLGVAIQHPSLVPDPYPFWDASMTVLSIAAMVLMTRKHIENWFLWCIINLISIVIYALQGVYAMSLQYAILFFIALFGCVSWMKAARMHSQSPH